MRTKEEHQEIFRLKEFNWWMTFDVLECKQSCGVWIIETMRMNLKEGKC